jgi:TldD protein
MPVKYDPFDIPVGEKFDVMNAFIEYATDYQVGVAGKGAMDFNRQHRWFASSDDASFAQTTYCTAASFVVTYQGEDHLGLNGGAFAAEGLTPTGRGWEVIADASLIDQIPALIAQAEQTRHQVLFEVGRYDVVCSANAIGALLDQTLGLATELDRALGYEADAAGTSYLDDPLGMLGTQIVASPLISVTANRSVAGGLATVRWDDEGVVPDEFTLIKNGVLVDYQTTREQAAWIAPYYQRTHQPIQSHGCARAPSALGITMQHAPNLAMVPGQEDTSFDDLVAGTERGIAILSCDIVMDQQGLNGFAGCTMREIVRGKLGRYLRGGALMFRAPELWKNVVAVGGPASLRWFGTYRGKGQPGQGAYHSVGAVPAKIKQLSIVDPGRTS